jgi:hypothetical protein
MGSKNSKPNSNKSTSTSSESGGWTDDSHSSLKYVWGWKIAGHAASLIQLIQEHVTKFYNTGECINQCSHLVWLTARARRSAGTANRHGSWAESHYPVVFIVFINRRSESRQSLNRPGGFLNFNKSARSRPSPARLTTWEHWHQFRQQPFRFRARDSKVCGGSFTETYWASYRWIY